MSNSSLVSVTKLSPNHSGPRNQKIVGIAIHCMAGNLSAEGCGDWMMKSATRASSNYGIGGDGKIGLYVDEANRSWCTSSSGVDNRAVTIEVSNTIAAPPWPVSDAAYKSLINLCVDICVRNDIEMLKWEASKEHGVNFNVNMQNMWAHRWFSNKECPGDYLYSRFGDIASIVNSTLKSMSTADRDKIKSGAAYTPTAVSGSTSGISGSTASQALNVKKYIATVDRNTDNQSYKKFNKKDIIGVVIEAGYLFDKLHKKVEFQSPKLDAQVKAIADAGLCYGWYFTARGRTTDEIREEVYELSFVLRKYPPKLGLWLKLDLQGDKNKQDKLLNDYYNRLLKLGFYNQLGLYVNSTQLKKINWSKHKKKWWLWKIDHFKKNSDFKQKLTYEMFKTPKEELK